MGYTITQLYSVSVKLGNLVALRSTSITCTLKKNGKGLEAIKLGENSLENCPSLHKMLKKGF